LKFYAQNKVRQQDELLAIFIIYSDDGNELRNSVILYLNFHISMLM